MSSYYGATPDPGHEGFIPGPPGSQQEQASPIIPSPMNFAPGLWHPGGQDWMAIGQQQHQRPQQGHQWGAAPQRPAHYREHSQDRLGGYPAGHPWGGSPNEGPPPLAPMHGTPWHAPAGMQHMPPPGPPPGMAPYMTTPRTQMMQQAMLYGGATPPTMPMGMPMGYPGMYWPSPGGMPRNLEEPDHMAGYRQPNRPVGKRMDEGVFVDSWKAGKDYGPTLNRRTIKLLHVKPEINPLLLPPNARAEGAYLEWNMLFPDSQIHLSTDPKHLSWSEGRKAPATVPRTDTLTIIIPQLPWTHTVKSKNAITCHLLLSEVYKFLHTYTAPNEYSHLPMGQQQQIYAAYQENRSRGEHVPGGQLPPQMLKIDFLARNTMFEGFTLDSSYTKERLSASKAKGKGFEDPCAVVLLCGPRVPPGHPDEQGPVLPHDRPSSRNA